MALISKKNFEKMLNECLAKFCDKRIIETIENIDPEGYNKMRTVIWYYRPYTFHVKYLLGGSEECPNFLPVKFTTRLDGDTEEQKLETGNDLIQQIQKAQVMREAGIV